MNEISLLVWLPSALALFVGFMGRRVRDPSKYVSASVGLRSLGSGVCDNEEPFDPGPEIVVSGVAGVGLVVRGTSSRVEILSRSSFTRWARSVSAEVAVDFLVMVVTSLVVVVPDIETFTEAPSADIHDCSIIKRWCERVSFGARVIRKSSLRFVRFGKKKPRINNEEYKDKYLDVKNKTKQPSKNVYDYA